MKKLKAKYLETDLRRIKAILKIWYETVLETNYPVMDSIRKDAAKCMSGTLRTFQEVRHLSKADFM